MKILIYAHHFPPFKGGMEYSNFEIAKGLHKLEHQVEVVACRNYGVKKFISDLDFRVHLLPKWPYLRLYSLSGSARANWAFQRVYRSILLDKIKRFRPNIILVSDETSNCFWGKLVKHIDIPYVSYCSVPFLAVNLRPGRLGILSRVKFSFNKAINSRFKEYMIESYSQARQIITVSRSTKRELLKIVPKLAAKMDIIPRSIGDYYFDEPLEKAKNIAIRKELGISPGDIILLSASSLIPSKGIHDVIKAVSKLKGSLLEKVRYVIVGRGPSEAYLHNLAKKCRIEKNVIFANEVSNKELIGYYDFCDFFVLPSRKGKEESFGRVFAEAGARFKPSIGVNQGGVTDVIDDGLTGFLIPVGDIEMLRDRITLLSIDEQKREIMGKRARDKAENNFRSKNIAVKFEKCLSRNAEFQY